jgi:phenylacetic acid degradation operon negative regulatory protein
VTTRATDVRDTITGPFRLPSRGRSVGLVAFLFGIVGAPTVAGPVLRRLLVDLDVSDDAARALLSRMVRQGWLASERSGRYTHYRLAGEFARGFERIRTQSQTRPPAWPGHFHALLYSVPEEHRDFRDGLRRAAVLAGYGILQPGVLIAPEDRSAVLAPELAGRPPGTQVWLTTLAMDSAQAAAAVSLAWGLPGLAAIFRGHIERLTSAGPVPGDGAAVLRTYADRLMPALTDTLREPALPRELFPADWPGDDLRRAVGGFTRTYGPAAERYVLDLVSSGPGR